jgi:hypothetical protein
VSLINEESEGDDGSQDHGRRTASAIYGTIITASVIAAGATLTTRSLAVTVVVTLVVYWLAEQYAVLVGEHTHGGRLPSRSQVAQSMGTTAPMITASFIPVVVLVVVRVLGASSGAAAKTALVVAVALLVVHGVRAGWAAGLRGLRLAAITVVAGLFGLAMVALKTFLQHYH